MASSSGWSGTRGLQSPASSLTPVTFGEAGEGGLQKIPQEQEGLSRQPQPSFSVSSVAPVAPGLSLSPSPGRVWPGSRRRQAQLCSGMWVRPPWADPFHCPFTCWGQGGGGRGRGHCTTRMPPEGREERVDPGEGPHLTSQDGPVTLISPTRHLNEVSGFSDVNRLFIPAVNPTHVDCSFKVVF